MGRDGRHWRPGLKSVSIGVERGVIGHTDTVIATAPAVCEASDADYNTDEEWAPNPHQALAERHMADMRAEALAGARMRLEMNGGARFEDLHEDPATFYEQYDSCRAPQKTKDVYTGPFNWESESKGRMNRKFEGSRNDKKLTLELLERSLNANDFGGAEALLCNLPQESDCAMVLLPLLRGYAKAGNVHLLSWCAGMAIKFCPAKTNTVSLNRILGACARRGDIREAISWWQDFTHVGVKPNLISYNIMIHCCARGKRVQSAEWWMEKMLKDGITPCPVSFASLITACAHSGSASIAETWFLRMRARGLKGDLVLYNSFLGAIAKAGDADKAEHWFHEMQKEGIVPDEKSYNILIHACSKARDMARAQHWYEMMHTAGQKADHFTFGSLIDACASTADCAMAEFWAFEMQRARLTLNQVCLKSMVKVYAQTGEYHRARRCFQHLLHSGGATAQDLYGVATSAEKHPRMTMVQRLLLEVIGQVSKGNTGMPAGQEEKPKVPQQAARPEPSSLDASISGRRKGQRRAVPRSAGIYHST